MNKNIVHVKMFSGFSMEYKDYVLTDENIRSGMITKLLVYILCNHKKVLHVSELCDVLWKDDESENSAEALKNLMY